MLFFVLFLLLSMCRFSDVQALSDEEVKVMFTKIVMSCTKDVPVEMTELMSLQQLKTPTDRSAKCLLACAYKKEGSMNNKGMVDTEHTARRANEIAGDEPKRLANALKMAEICGKVNEKKVSDGAKGCDRAALLFECVIKTGPKLGFKV